MAPPRSDPAKFFLVSRVFRVTGFQVDHETKKLLGRLTYLTDDGRSVGIPFSYRRVSMSKILDVTCLLRSHLVFLI